MYILEEVQQDGHYGILWAAGDEDLHAAVLKGIVLWQQLDTFWQPWQDLSQVPAAQVLVRQLAEAL
jgi:hypothetical protein